MRECRAVPCPWRHWEEEEAWVANLSVICSLLSTAADALQLEIKQGVEARQALEREMAEQASVHSKQMASAEQGLACSILSFEKKAANNSP